MTDSHYEFRGELERRKVPLVTVIYTDEDNGQQIILDLFGMEPQLHPPVDVLIIRADDPRMNDPAVRGWLEEVVEGWVDPDGVVYRLGSEHM